MFSLNSEFYLGIIYYVILISPSNVNFTEFYIILMSIYLYLSESPMKIFVLEIGSNFKFKFLSCIYNLKNSNTYKREEAGENSLSILEKNLFY